MLAPRFTRRCLVLGVRQAKVYRSRDTMSLITARQKEGGGQESGPSAAFGLGAGEFQCTVLRACVKSTAAG